MPAETTDKYVRIRIKDPDLFQPDSFRIIDISEEDGIRAVVGKLKGETTTTIQSYLFDVERWSESEAEAWVEKHKKQSAQPQREYKSFPILTKEIGEDRIVKSLFAITGHVDHGNDRIWQGAFTKTLQERADRIRVLWQHDASEPPVGVPVMLKEIKRAELPESLLAQYPDATGGLLGHIKYLPTPRGDEILVGIREGAITENSIGYDPVAGKFDYDAKNVRNLRELRLWDVSPVNWGMQELAVNLKRALPLTEADIAQSLAWLNQKVLLDARDAVATIRQSIGLNKEGRVLSARNLERLKNALSVLNELLLTAEPPEEEGKVLQDVMTRLALAERELSLY